MRIATAVLLGAASLAACRRTEMRTSREIGEAQIIALSVRTEPSGATVRVNRLARAWTTPCDIADYSLGRGTLEVSVALEGYQPVSSKVSYDGYDPAWLKVKLAPLAGPAPVAAAPSPIPAPPPPAPVQEKAAPPPPPPQKSAEAPVPVKVEPGVGGFWIRTASATGKIRVQAKSVISDSDRPGDVFIPDNPPGRVTVEFLDPKNGAVMGSVEISRGAAPLAAPAPPAPAPKDPPAADADRVGEVRFVSKTYGVFVKLDPGLSIQPGEEILIVRNGVEVARTKILKIMKADPQYPDGAAQVQKDGSIQRGDEARRLKP